MFYDRLRGKKFGTTSIIRFPLRMLSVQQLDRILRLVVCCELSAPPATGSRAPAMATARPGIWGNASSWDTSSAAATPRTG